jgi:RimJ/RimL family protein N-acetyltransferase
VTTDRVRLRPCTEEDLASLELMFSDPESIGVYNWSGWGAMRTWRKRFEENGLLADDRSVLMVDSVDGEQLGFISWRPADAASPFLSWEIGISLWPTARGHGYGSETQRLLVRYLFAHTQVNRIQAQTDIENVAEQRALEKAGFTREGVLRGKYFRDGQWRDEVIYAVVRSDLAPATAASPSRAPDSP